METALFLTTQNEQSQIPLPVMTIIALLLLMLPYLIRRYTGRSVTEWLRFSVIFDGLEGLASKVRGALFGKRGGLLVKDSENRKAEEAAAKEKKAAARQAAAHRQEEQDRTRKKQRAGNVRNDYLQAVSRILTFARKNRLFAVIPGNIAFQGKSADLTAGIVTHARAVGIVAHGFDGTVLCRCDDQPWQVQGDDGTRQIGALGREAKEQHALVKGAMQAAGMGDIPYETVMLFTSSAVTLSGKRPDNAFTCETLFETLSRPSDLSDGPLDPKETGRQISLLRAGKEKKR